MAQEISDAGLSDVQPGQYPDAGSLRDILKGNLEREIHLTNWLLRCADGDFISFGQMQEEAVDLVQMLGITQHVPIE